MHVSAFEQPDTHHYIVAVVKQVHLLPVKNHHDTACRGQVSAVLCFRVLLQSNLPTARRADYDGLTYQYAL